MTVIISEHNRIFGGFTDISWTSIEKGSRRRSGKGNSFLFAVHNDQVYKLKCLEPYHEVYHYADKLPVFGFGHYLCLEGYSSGSSNTQSKSYAVPNIKNPNNFLGGS